MNWNKYMKFLGISNYLFEKLTGSIAAGIEATRLKLNFITLFSCNNIPT